MKRLFALMTTIFLIVAPMLSAQSADPSSTATSAETTLSSGGGSEWVVAVNLVIWTGLFLYLLALHGKIRALEKKP